MKSIVGSRRCRGLVLALSVVAVLALSGCSTQKSGAAAVAGDQRLTEAQMSDLFDELDALYGANPDAQRLPNDQITLSVLSWWVNEQLLNAIADDRDLSVTPTEVDQVLGSDPEQQKTISLTNGIPPSRLPDAARVYVLSQALTDSLTADGASAQEADKELTALLQQTADDLGVSVNPRFGSWNAEAVAVEPRNPDRLSSPAPGTSPPQLDVPPQG